MAFAHPPQARPTSQPVAPAGCGYTLAPPAAGERWGPGAQHVLVRGLAVGTVWPDRSRHGGAAGWSYSCDSLPTCLYPYPSLNDAAQAMLRRAGVA